MEFLFLNCRLGGLFSMKSGRGEGGEENGARRDTFFLHKIIKLVRESPKKSGEFTREVRKNIDVFSNTTTHPYFYTAKLGIFTRE